MPSETPARKIELARVFEDLFKPARYKVLYGGRGSGKSWGVSRALILQGAQKRLRILCTRELQNSITESVHRLLSDQIESMGFSSLFTIQNNSIRGLNGTEFIFEGLKHNVDKVRSLEGVDIVWIEEADSITEDSWNVLIPTIRKAGSEIWATFNPRFPTDYIHKKFVHGTPPENSLVKCVNWQDNPWFPEELRIEKDHLKAEDPKLYEHIWEGKLLDESDAQFISLELVDSARARQLDVREFAIHPLLMGVDPARFGDDQSVITLRQGNKVHDIVAFRKLDTMELAAKVWEMARERAVGAIFVDGTGVGAGVVDRLKQLDMPVVDVVVAAAPEDPVKYANLRVELWGRMKTWLEYADLPDHEGLRQDLITPEYTFDSKMRYVLEKKDSIKKRGLPSPDYGDSLALTFAQQSYRNQITAGPVHSVSARAWS